MTRQRVALLSHVGYDAYRHDDGSPFFPPDEFDVTLIPVDLDAPAAPLPVDGREFDWVVATQERLLLPAARLREALGIAGMGTEHTLLLRDKVAMKHHFSAHGIQVPRFTEISEPIEASALLEKFGQIVIKPVHGAGSADVHIIRSQDELIGLQRQGFATSDRYEAEEFIDGRQFHIDSAVSKGVPVAVSVSQYLDSHETFPLNGQIRSHTLDDGPNLELLVQRRRTPRSVPRQTWHADLLRARRPSRRSRHRSRIPAPSRHVASLLQRPAPDRPRRTAHQHSATPGPTCDRLVDDLPAEAGPLPRIHRTPASRLVAPAHDALPPGRPSPATEAINGRDRHRNRLRPRFTRSRRPSRRGQDQDHCIDCRGRT
jgi:hypothetical protein